MTGHQVELQGKRQGSEREMKAKGTRNEGDTQGNERQSRDMNGTEARCRREMTGTCRDNKGDMKGSKDMQGTGSGGCNVG